MDCIFIAVLLAVIGVVTVTALFYFRDELLYSFKQFKKWFGRHWKALAMSGIIVSTAAMAAIPFIPTGNQSFNNTESLGWEFLDNNTVVHAWNTQNSYYFNASNGVQFSNHYNEYWTRNVLMLGYFDGDEWVLVYRTDELSGFNQDFEGSTDVFMNLTLWKDLTYGGYSFRLALRYHLGVDDSDLTIIPYIKNLGDSIPFVLGFGWEMKDIQIANVSNDNYVWLYNSTSNSTDKILLNQTLNKTYTSMDYNTSINLVCTNPPSPYLSRNLYLRWNSSLDYKVVVKSRVGQVNAPVTLFIRVGTLAIGQEKYTMMHWLDADDWLGIGSAELDSLCGEGVGNTLADALDGADSWAHLTTETHWFVIDLGQTYTIKKVRGRSLTTYDPIDVNIYIDDSNPPTTLCEEGITTWQDTSSWVEITLTSEGTGQYIKVEIEGTEHPVDRIIWGGADPYFTIFDAYGDVAGGPPANTAPTVSGESVWDGTTNHSYNATCVLIPPSSWNVTLNDPEGDTMDWYVRTNHSGVWQDVNFSGNLANGTYSNHTNTSWVDTRATKYWISYNVTDGTDWTNNTYTITTIDEPTTWLYNPANSSTGVILSPTVHISVNTTCNYDVDVYWLENSTGSWVQRQTNKTVSPEVQLNWTFTEASTYGTQYWYKINISQAGTSSPNSTRWYTFTTGFSQTIRTNNIDYFVWLGVNTSACYVKNNITGLDEATEYVAILNNTAVWNYFYGDNSGTNWTIHTFDVIKTYMDDAVGNTTFTISGNPNIDYDAARTVPLIKKGNGYNYTGYTNNTVNTSLAAINNTLTLPAGYFCALWNRTTFTWNYWISGFGITDIPVFYYNVIVTKIDGNKSWTM